MTDHFQHPAGICESEDVGAGTRIWAFAHVLPGAHIGRDCNVCDHVFIENDVWVGDRVTIKCGVQLWDGIHIEDDVFVGPNVTFTNDPFPRSTVHLDEYPRTFVRRGASIGANATILPGLEIGTGSMIGAGSVVTRSVPPHAIVVGNPARIAGYTRTSPTVDAPPPYPQPAPGTTPPSVVAGVRLIDLPLVEDLRGHLTVGETPGDLSFVPHRYFVVFAVPSSRIRGEHAHHVCEQFLVCLHGQVSVMVDDGRNRAEHLLNAPNRGLYVPPLVWAAQFNYSPDAVLLVLASHKYDASDYIRDYSEFMQLIEGTG